MWEWLIPVLIVVAVLIAVGIYLWATYTSLVQLNGRVDEAWREIEAQLDQRGELLVPLTDTVKIHAAHERAALDEVARARADVTSAQTPGDAGSAEGHVQRALRSLYAAAEGYPQLQASQEFLGVQQSLADAEQQLQASRRFYNGGVRELNGKIKGFPHSMFARRLGISEREFFEAQGGVAVSEPPRIQF